MEALRRAAGAKDYNALWEWSVADLPRFWSWIWDRYEVQADGDPTTVLGSAEMPGARWFPDVQLSFPEHIFRGKRGDEVALRFASEGRSLQQWTWGELRRHTARVRAGLQALGVGRGDRVAGLLPNVPETVAAFLATASLGAIWSCCSPDFGAAAAVDRFAQIEPRVLLAIDSYSYGGRDYDRSPVIEEIAASLPTLEDLVRIPHAEIGAGWASAFPAADQPLRFERVAFDHPLWIVFSSGTTGPPKGIVHGHGGPLLELLKTWRLHQDVREGDTAFWYTTSGWIMWNYLVAALLSPVSIVLYDGHPGHPGPDALWDLADRAGVTLFGAGAAYFHGCMSTGVEPLQGRRLHRLRSLGSTGSPLAAEAYGWVREKIGSHISLNSTSGGTDIAGAFLGGAPLAPVYEGELPARMLGVAVESWDDHGHPIVDQVGELVVTEPMPSMPIRFWNDPGNRRLHEAYFSKYEGVWRHGDWIRITPRGSAVIYGRSDATINRGGIRMGTAEIYAAVLSVEKVDDALVIDIPGSRDAVESSIVLFVVLEEGTHLTSHVIGEIRARVRRDCSPRHVPDEIVEAPAVPRTSNGKLLEVPVKRLIMGIRLDASTDAAEDTALEWFAEFAANRDPVVSMRGAGKT